jgi:diacylglycerol kinase
MSGLSKSSEDSAYASSVGILSDEDRIALTQQTTAKYAAELEGLLIPVAWRRKNGRASTLFESFYHAFHGVWVGIKRERNLRIHFAMIPVVMALAIALHVDAVAWMMLTLSMGLVITAEFLNSALEHLVDLTTQGEYHLSARYAKDTAAAAVLAAAVGAVVIGAIVFVPAIFAQINAAH